MKPCCLIIAKRETKLALTSLKDNFSDSTGTGYASRTKCPKCKKKIRVVVDYPEENEEDD